MADSSHHRRTTEDWSAEQYLKFADERTRPPRDLLAQVLLGSPRRVVDLGCGPGNSTELLVERFPDAEVIGVDSSPDMLRQARQQLPRCTFVEGNLSTWMPEEGTDLLFGNAVFHWVPDHPKVLARLLQSLPPGGVLAVQMPDNTNEPALRLMEKVAASGSLRPMRRATTYRGRKATTIYCVRCVATSTSGTPTTITSSRITPAWSNGSRARGCAHSSRHLPRRCARLSLPITPMRSGSPIRHVRTAR